MSKTNIRFSDFSIVTQVGQGGFGSTYLARRNSDGKDVCLKLIPLNSGFTEPRILQEAQTLSRLKNILVGSDHQFALILLFVLHNPLA